MPHSGGASAVGALVDIRYEVLKSAVEFEALAAASPDPHIKAAYANLARRYRELGTGELQTTTSQQLNRHDRHHAKT
jgi:hypothetical protein